MGSIFDGNTGQTAASLKRQREVLKDTAMPCNLPLPGFLAS